MVVAKQPLHLSELSNALGIRENSEDYSPKRIRKAALIESLCSHLVIFDRTVKGRENDPLLKFAHKSVKDFFLEDPLVLNVTKSLHPFFVNLEAGNLEIGRACVTYLSYDRYQNPQVHHNVFFDNDPDGEHAFLKYAATFWFWHLINTDHSRSLFDFVEKFIRSPAFWTCIAVQCKIAPHLFAPLMEAKHGHYHLGQGYSGGCNSNEAVSFSFPLPDWLEEYSPSGPIIVQEFLAFIKEWHPVLTSCPQAINQCLTKVSGCGTYPCRNPFECKGIRAINLLHTEVRSGNSSNVSLQNLQLERSSLSVLAIEQQESSLGRLIIVRRTEIASEKPSSKEVARKQMCTLESSVCDLQISFDAGVEQISIWSLDLISLRLVQHPGSTQKVFTPTDLTEGIKAAVKTGSTTPWTIGLKDTNRTAYGNVISYHCTKNARAVRDESDSGYGASVTDSNSDLDQDQDSDADLDEDVKDIALPVDYHCLVLAYQEGTPMWFSWQTDAGMELQVVHANHPIKPIAVWSHSSHELRTADLRTGRIEAGILPEPVDIQLRSAAAVRKGKTKLRSHLISVTDALLPEFHFSSDGKILYYLLCTFVDGGVGSTCSVSVSSFNFINGLDNVEDMQRSQPAQHITYQLNKPVDDLCAPYILTHWSSTHLYIALPPLSYNPKIVRFALTPTNISDSPSSAFQTLNSHVYFPLSAPSRNPKLFMHSTTEVSDDPDSRPSERLILALDQHCSLEPNEKNTHSTLPPVLMTWSTSEGSSWRDWEPELDDRSPECKTDIRAYDMLRGTFVDSEQRFSIPIRSGLDWTKKAFVSCA